MTEKQWIRDITGPLTVQAIVQYLHLWVTLQDTELQLGLEDQICWRWNASLQYSAKSAYDMFFCGSVKLAGANLLWKTWAPPRVKWFMTLALHRGTWTAERRKRHGLQDHDECALCDQDPESVEHLLLHCAMSKQIWWNTLDWLGMSSRFVGSNLVIAETWSHLRNGLPKQTGKELDTIFVLVAWQLWKERNARVFQREASTEVVVLARIKEEALAWVAAGARNLGSLMPRE